MAVNRFEILASSPPRGRRVLQITGRRRRALRRAERTPALRDRPRFILPIGASPTWSWPLATPRAASSSSADVSHPATRRPREVQRAADARRRQPRQHGRGPELQPRHSPAVRAGLDPNPPIDAGDGFLMRRGFVVISCGWQLRRPRDAGPLAPARAGGARCTGQPLRGASTRSSSPRAVRDISCSPIAVTCPTPRPTSTSAARVLTVPTARRAGSASRASAGASPRRWRTRGARRAPRPARRRLREGPPVPGHLHGDGRAGDRAGHAALRDACPGSSTAPRRRVIRPRRIIRRAYAYGRSQTGRLLRTFVYHDLNVDEAGRESLDGIIANVAGGMRGEFNQRFGQNSKDRTPDDGARVPFADAPRPTPTTGLTDAFHARIAARGSRAEGFLHELLGRVPPGRRLPDPHGSRRRARRRARAARPRVPLRRHRARARHLAPVRHPDGPRRCHRPRGAFPALRGIVDYAPLLRACLVNLDRWVTEGVEPPPSRHPRLADGTAVAPERCAAFERIPERRYPRAPEHPHRLDFGPTHAVAAGRRAYGSLVSPSTPMATSSRASSCPSSRCRSPPIPAGTCATPTSAAPSSSWSSRAPRSRFTARATSATPRATRAAIEERYASATTTSRAYGSGASSRPRVISWRKTWSYPSWRKALGSVRCPGG